MGKLIKIEFLKIKKSNVLSAAIGITLFSLLMTFSGIATIKDTLPKDIWEGLYLMTMNVYALFFYPILISIIVTMMVRLENQNNMWKALLANPVDKMKIYMSKLICIFIIIAISISLTTLGIIIIGFFKTNSINTVPTYIMLAPLKAYLSSLASITILYLISLSFKNFFIPLTVGFLGIFISLFTTVSDDLYAFNPFGYSGVLILNAGKTEKFNILILISILLMLITLFIIKFIFGKKDIT